LKKYFRAIKVNDVAMKSEFQYTSVLANMFI